ncbi:leucine-rich repeat-containing protein 17 [Protobothrops mucrosquamatus]|uniref:leucine-rich repeat-containing protein 17 n=2 Tax=Protobothrops mucrosquamatus TaxID=103944 RepID=UPI000775E7DB|nr:leucine-rich repeat-containing protein 17 [Protobothrops mucrosquamatus]
MQMVTIIILLFFSQAADLRKGRNGNSRRKANNGRGNGLGKGSGLAKRFTPNPPCDVYTYLFEKYLDCQDRKLTFVPPEGPEDLKHMLLSQNAIRKLKNNMFSRFQKLKSLDLQQNQISKIEDQAFWGLNKLTTLLLQHNKLKVLSEEVFIYMPFLSYLRLYDNPWHCSCQLESLVTMLQLPRNRNLANYAKCAQPEEAKGRKLKDLQAEQFCGDKADLPPAPKPEIARPEFDSSLCHTYVFPVKTLDCRRKDLKKVPSNISPDTVKLDISSNKITLLRPKEFEEIDDLRVLNLSSNGLIHIDPAAFAGLINLEELDLSSNSLQNIEYGVLEHLYFLKILRLKENPWRCDYNIHYLFYWLKHHYNVHYNGLECQKPGEYKGWSVRKYVRSYFEECPKDRLPIYPDVFEDNEIEETALKHSVIVRVID